MKQLITDALAMAGHELTPDQLAIWEGALDQFATEKVTGAFSQHFAKGVTVPNLCDIVRLCQKPKAALIIQHIAEERGVTVDALLGPCRQHPLVHIRQEAYSVLRRDTDMSLPQIGRIFQGRDHTTIMHGIKAHEARAAQA